MKITVVRKTFDELCTMGEMSVDGDFECFTLEPPNQPDIDPVAPKGCIPAGEYPVTITFSGHFQRDMPLVNNVPDFDEIRIHPLNFPAQTEGCCGVGEFKGKDEILKSVAAFEPLFAKIKAAIDNGDDVTIEYLEAL